MKYNSIGEQLIAKAKEIDPSYKPDKFNDMSEALDVILNNTGGGKSVPPTLDLIDHETTEVRTTITEEEYNNLKNGLYNQVIYHSSDDVFSVYSPSKLINAEGECYFAQFKISLNTDKTFSYSSMVLNAIIIGEKNNSNEYPITITEAFTINPSASDFGGVPVVEGTLNEPASSEDTKYYHIPETQTSAFIFHSSDIGYMFVNVMEPNNVINNSYMGMSPMPYGQWSLLYGNGPLVCVNTYTPATLHPINVDGSFPRDETSSVDVTFPAADKAYYSICLVTDKDVSMVFLKDGRNTGGSFQTPITYCNDGKYRYWYMDPKKGDNTLATIKCKVLNLDGGNTNILPLPADASTSTYVLKAVNGTVQWVKES